MGMPSDDDGEKKEESKASGFRPGGSDPDLRAKDLDEDGVWGEVLYPTIALFGFMIPDPELRWACAACLQRLARRDVRGRVARASPARR